MTINWLLRAGLAASMDRMEAKIFLTCLLFGGLCLGASDSRGQKKWEDAKWNQWKVALSPYFWYIGFNGTVSRAPATTDEPVSREWEIDVGFKDIKGALKFALMLSGEYQGAKALVLFNFTSFIIQGEAITPRDLVVQDLEGRLGFAAGEVFGGYRFLSSHPKLDVDGDAGLKFWHNSINLKSQILGNIPVEGARSMGWVDPALGLRVKYIPHPRVETHVLRGFRRWDHWQQT